jgi:hypothetical protein
VPLALVQSVEFLLRSSAPRQLPRPQLSQIRPGPVCLNHLVLARVETTACRDDSVPEAFATFSGESVVEGLGTFGGVDIAIS